jgi:hypothetical protein
VLLDSPQDHERVLRLYEHLRAALDARDESVRGQPLDDFIRVRPPMPA